MKIFFTSRFYIINLIICIQFPMNEVNNFDVKVGDINKYVKPAECWRRWYPYATLIHRESESETLDTITERLEKAMENYDPVIIIRCYHLGELFRVWWNAGNTIKNTASALSLSSLIICSERKDRLPQILAISGISLSLLYACLWETDRSARYTIQPKNNFSEMDGFKEAQEVVLVRRNPAGCFRTVLALSTVAVFGYYYYKEYIM